MSDQPKSRSARSREKILQSAATLFAHRGFDNVSIDDLMADAGLTRGAFYSHFKDKSALYAEAISHAAGQSRLGKENLRRVAKYPADSLLRDYLSREHIDEKSAPCPLAFMVNDVSQRDPVVRSTYTRVYRNMVKRISRLSPTTGKPERETLFALTAMMIGGVAIARTLNDEKLEDELLDACYHHGLALLTGD